MFEVDEIGVYLCAESYAVDVCLPTATDHEAVATGLDLDVGNIHVV